MRKVPLAPRRAVSSPVCAGTAPGGAPRLVLERSVPLDERGALLRDLRELGSSALLGLEQISVRCVRRVALFACKKRCSEEALRAPRRRGRAPTDPKSTMLLDDCPFQPRHVGQGRARMGLSGAGQCVLPIGRRKGVSGRLSQPHRLQ